MDIDKIAEVHRQLDRVLLFQWDPIGVVHNPEAHDEYRSYCRQIYDIAVQSRSANAVADLLVLIERDAMGLRGRPPEQLLPVAHKVLEIVSGVGPLP